MPNPVDEHEEHEGADANPQGEHVRFADDGKERVDLFDDALAVDFGAGHFAELADDHEDGRASEIADEQRLGQQFGDNPEAQHARQEAPSGDDERQRGTERGGLDRIAMGKGGDRHAGDERDGGLRTDREHPRLAHDGIHDEGAERGREAHLRGTPTMAE